MIASFQQFHCFMEDLGKKTHDLSRDVLKVMLTNYQPLPAQCYLADLIEIEPGPGYVKGGSPVAGNRWGQVKGAATLTAQSLLFQGEFGPFRYAVIYNASTAFGPLIGWWDYGLSSSVKKSDIFRVNLEKNIFTLRVANGLEKDV